MKAKTDGKTDNRSTIGGPSHPEGEAANQFTAKLAAAQGLAAAMPYNINKALENGEVSSLPEKGQTVEPPDPSATGSTLTETMSSDKAGSGKPRLGFNAGNEPLDRARVDSGDRALTTNQGVPVADNQNSLKAGYRGPALLEDFILREKITHFDHERIPERIVHARGSAAHGYFECYESLEQYTRASLFSGPGKRTPVFVRFSTVFGERGSADTARDARGFAVKFYTEEGNWDLVGNNIPVFFIQDAMKFPDLVHAAKPEPHFAMPQASTAHDTFWDFVSLMPESMHMLMWVMSDRAIPRSFRTMQGFGVHTFRLVTAGGESRFVKFHWQPLAGTHSLEWEEAVKIAGADPDFHRRDLWEAIECGAFPEYELGMQIFTEAQAEKFSFDVLDATKIIPEELVPVRPVGKMILNRNPDNFFAETEQVAFCAAHIVPGLDFSSDPLLAGRIHSYVDTQISRLGGPNFHEIPINSPVAQVHNNQRDGMHRQGINRGRVAYEPNSLGGGCPFQAGAAGFTSFREPIAGDKVRGKPERFADHYTQATLFWKSQTPIEQEHIINAFRFELTRVQTPAIRERTLAMLANVAQELAESVAEGLGMALPPAQPRAMQNPPVPEVESSPALSLFSRPGDPNIRMRRIAILVAEGVNGRAVAALRDGLSREQAVPRFVGTRLGTVRTADGDELEADITFETMPSVLFDALVVAGGDEEDPGPVRSGEAVEFIRDQYRYCKPILVLKGGKSLVESAGVKFTLPSGELDPGVLYFEDQDYDVILPQFIEAIAAHRHFEREIEPRRS
jgi:catalase